MHTCQRSGVVQLDCDGERFFECRQRVFAATHLVQAMRLRHEQTHDSLAVVQRSSRLQTAIERIGRLIVSTGPHQGHTQGSRPWAVVRGLGGRFLQRFAPQSLGDVESAHVGVRAGEERQHVGACRARRCLSGGEVLESRLEIVDGFGVGSPLEGGAPGGHEVSSCLLLQTPPIRPGEVERELVGVLVRVPAVEGLHGLRHRAMHHAHALESEFLVDRLTHDRVAEVVYHVSPVATFVQDSLTAQLLDGGQHVGAGEPAHGFEQRVAHPRTQDGGQLGHGAGRLGESLKTCHDRVANRTGHLEVRRVPAHPHSGLVSERTRGDERLDDFLEEEGIAPRPAEQHRSEFADGAGVGLEGRAHQLGDPVPVERLELDDLGEAVRRQRALGLGEAGQPVPFLVVVGAEDQHLVTLNLPCQKVDELQRGIVRPLDVLENAHEWFACGVSLHELGEVPHEAGAEFVRVGRRGLRDTVRCRTQRREEVAELGIPAPAQDRERVRVHVTEDREPGVREDRVGGARFHRIGATRGDRRFQLSRPGQQFESETRLAHTALATQEDDPRAVVGRGHQRLQTGKLAVASHERQRVGKNTVPGRSRRVRSNHSGGTVGGMKLAVAPLKLGLGGLVRDPAACYGVGYIIGAHQRAACEPVENSVSIFR